MSIDLLGSENKISIYQGQSKEITLIVKDSKNVAIDITGCTIIFSVMENLTDSSHLFQKRSSDIAQIELTAPREGKAVIYISSSDTVTLDANEYVYDVWIIRTNGNKDILVEPSVFEVKRAVTKFS